MTGEPGRPGVRVGSSLIDMGTGMWAALGIVAALLERERTGTGAVVDTSLYETALGYIGYHLVGFLADGTVPTRPGNGLPDGRAVPGLPDPRRRAHGRGRQRPPLRGRSARCSASRSSADERFRTNPDRVRNREELVGDRLGSVFARTTRPTGTSASPRRGSPPRRSPTSPRSSAPSRRRRSAAPARRASRDPGSSPARASALVRPRARDALPPPRRSSASTRPRSWPRPATRQDEIAALPRTASFVRDSFERVELGGAPGGEDRRDDPDDDRAITNTITWGRREREDEEVDAGDEQRAETTSR